jgi:hypothetical protein
LKKYDDKTLCEVGEENLNKELFVKIAAIDELKQSNFKEWFEVGISKKASDFFTVLIFLVSYFPGNYIFLKLGI